MLALAMVLGALLPRCNLRVLGTDLSDAALDRARAGRYSADALAHVAGYAIALDMSVRGPEDRSLRKSVDSYAVLGPWLQKELLGLGGPGEQLHAVLHG